VRRISRALLPLLAVGALLAGCSEEGSTINAQMREGDQKGYVAGDGSIESLTPEQRSTRVALEGTTLEDEQWTITDLSGSVVVVNVWGSWCGPCIAETPDLEEVAAGLREAGEPVQFIGVNSRDSVPSAQAFQEKYDVSYPSLQDDGGRTRAQLGSIAVATPTTLVVDGQGRLAARVSGQVDAATLRGLVDDVLAGETAG
jgi:thiol-disulfide isomerase/thioredoxin